MELKQKQSCRQCLAVELWSFRKVQRQRKRLKRLAFEFTCNFRYQLIQLHILHLAVSLSVSD
jgi:hypothetical protein